MRRRLANSYLSLSVKINVLLCFKDIIIDLTVCSYFFDMNINQIYSVSIIGKKKLILKYSIYCILLI